MIKSNPIPTEWVTHRKIIIPKKFSLQATMSGFPAWGSDKGTRNSQGIWP